MRICTLAAAAALLSALAACGSSAPAGGAAKEAMPTIAAPAMTAPASAAPAAAAPAAAPTDAPAGAAGDQAMPAEQTSAPEQAATMAPAADEPAAADMPSGPAWLSAELMNVRTGQPFRIADFKGQVVLVETLAVWCSNCLRQQIQVKALHESLPSRDDLVSVGLGIDLQESGEALKAFTGKHGFDWTYAIATPDVAREIGNLYGAQFLNPPSTPMLVIDKQGQAHPLPFGIKSAEALQQALEPFLSR
jgi:hypothetical protein